MSISFKGFYSQVGCRSELNSFSKQLPKTKTVADLNHIISRVNKIQKEIIPDLQLSPKDQADFDGIFTGINKSIKERSANYTNLNYISDLDGCKDELDKITYKDKRFGEVFVRAQENQFAAKTRTFKPAEKALYNDAVGMVEKSMRNHTLTHLVDDLTKCKSDLFRVLLKTEPREMAKQVATILDKVENIRQEAEKIKITAQEGVEFENLYRAIEDLTAQIDRQWLAKTPDPVRSLRRQLEVEASKLQNFQKQLATFTSGYHNPDLYAQVEPKVRESQNKVLLTLHQLNGQNKSGYEINRLKQFGDVWSKGTSEIENKLYFNPGMLSKVTQIGIHFVKNSYTALQAKVANGLAEL